MSADFSQAMQAIAGGIVAHADRDGHDALRRLVSDWQANGKVRRHPARRRFGDSIHEPLCPGVTEEKE